MKNASKLTAQDIYEYMEANATEQEKKDFKAYAFVWPNITIAETTEDGKPIWDIQTAEDGTQIRVPRSKKVRLNEAMADCNDSNKVYCASKANKWFLEHMILGHHATMKETGKKMAKYVSAVDLFSKW